MSSKMQLSICFILILSCENSLTAIFFCKVLRRFWLHKSFLMKIQKKMYFIMNPIFYIKYVSKFLLQSHPYQGLILVPLLNQQYHGYGNQLSKPGQ